MKHLVFKLRFIGLVAFAMLAALWPVTSQAATNPTLGNAGGFAVLAGTAASCTTSTITGGVGVNFNPPTTAGCNAQYAPGAYKAFQNVLTGTKPAWSSCCTPGRRASASARAAWRPCVPGARGIAASG